MVVGVILDLVLAGLALVECEKFVVVVVVVEGEREKVGLMNEGLRLLRMFARLVVVARIQAGLRKWRPRMCGRQLCADCRSLLSVGG